MPKTFQDKGSSKITLSDAARSSARAEAVFASFTLLTIPVPISANLSASVVTTGGDTHLVGSKHALAGAL